jgi:hypothetical protein
MDKQILLKYSGDLQFETIEILVQQAKGRLNDIEVKTIVKKKIINILIECLENIFRYTSFAQKNSAFFNKFLPKIILERDDGLFTIIAGNLVANENIEALRDKIDRANLMTPEKLQKSYEEIINNNLISEKGGAGLGIIDISIKSGNKLIYDFKAVDDKYSFFEIQVKIKEVT